MFMLKINVTEYIQCITAHLSKTTEEKFMCIILTTDAVTIQKIYKHVQCLQYDT